MGAGRLCLSCYIIILLVTQDSLNPFLIRETLASPGELVPDVLKQKPRFNISRWLTCTIHLQSSVTVQCIEAPGAWVAGVRTARGKPALCFSSEGSYLWGVTRLPSSSLMGFFSPSVRFPEPESLGLGKRR